MEAIKIEIRKLSRQPKALILISLCLIVILNVTFYLWQTKPQEKKREQANAALSGSQQVLDAVTLQTDPKRASDQDIVNLLTVVPITLLNANLIDVLLQFAGESEVYVTLFKQLTQIAASQSEQENETDSLSADPMFKPEFYEINVVGSLSKLLNFFDLIASNQMITVVEGWGIRQLTEGDAAAIPELVEKKGNYSLSMVYTLYTIPEYKSTFGDDAKLDTSIEQSLNELLQKNPELKPFKSITTEEGGQ